MASSTRRALRGEWIGRSATLDNVTRSLLITSLSELRTSTSQPSARSPAISSVTDRFSPEALAER